MITAIKIIPIIVLSVTSPINNVEAFSFKELPLIEKIFKAKKVDKYEGYTKVRARITYYTPYEDKWGSQVACPKTRRAKEGITVAAHPDFKFGTEVKIPELKSKVGDGTFIVQDRGGAVKSKKAAKGKAYVFDVFVSSNSKMRAHAKYRPMYMDVYIKK